MRTCMLVSVIAKVVSGTWQKMAGKRSTSTSASTVPYCSISRLQSTLDALKRSPDLAWLAAWITPRQDKSCRDCGFFSWQTLQTLVRLLSPPTQFPLPLCNWGPSGGYQGNTADTSSPLMFFLPYRSRLVCHQIISPRCDKCSCCLEAPQDHLVISKEQQSISSQFVVPLFAELSFPLLCAKFAGVATWCLLPRLTRYQLCQT